MVYLRVQTPTLAILVRRRKEIENFKPEGFCTVTADFGDFKGIWFKEGQDSDTHLKTKEEAQAIIDKVKGKTATIISCDTQHKRELPPQLYDLTSLQRDANRMLGYTADKTLKLAQSLYETHKAFTYPRTDSRYLPPDMVPKVEQTFTYLPQSMQSFIPGATPGGHIPVTKRTIDASNTCTVHVQSLLSAHRRCLHYKTASSGVWRSPDCTQKGYLFLCSAAFHAPEMPRRAARAAL